MSNQTQSSRIVTTDSWRKWCDACFWSNESPFADSSFGCGSVVFCKIDAVKNLFSAIRKSRRKIILVTGEGDLPCDKKMQSIVPKNVAHWFAQNVTALHSNVTAIPIGLGSPHSHVTLKADEILASRVPWLEKDRMLYVNFRPNTNWGERKLAYDHFAHVSLTEKWVKFESPYDEISNDNFLKSLVRHRFVLCPPGNGVDTHRMWETLLAGAIPVVKRSPAMEAFRDLPVLFVDDFREVTLNLLEKAQSEIAISAHPHDLMTESYWNKIIKAKQAEIREAPFISWKEWIADSVKCEVRKIAQRIGSARGGK